MSTFLVDGDNLLTIGFHGLKNYFYKGSHIGGIYHFLNTLRMSFDNYNLTKIVVFWDGVDGEVCRKKIYPWYKDQRKSRFKTEYEESSYRYQRNRVKQYLEEIYVRQGEYDFCETDDCIAYYTHQTPDEKKIIFSSDGDLTQLISKNTYQYHPSHRILYKPKDVYTYEREKILVENVKIAKMMCGDPSDNISGIRSLGMKTMMKLYPELISTPMTIDDIKEKTNHIFEEQKHNKLIQNILTGVTKYGVFGEEFYQVNSSIIDLSNPLLTDEAREGIDLLIKEKLDPDGRSYKHVMRMMMEDGISTLLPKRDDAWLRFLSPFLKLTRKEKNKKR